MSLHNVLGNALGSIQSAFGESFRCDGTAGTLTGVFALLQADPTLTESGVTQRETVSLVASVAQFSRAPVQADVITRLPSGDRYEVSQVSTDAINHHLELQKL